jgi:hypothetical protein
VNLLIFYKLLKKLWLIWVFSQVSSIKTFDFSTLYTILPHDKLKTRLKETIHKAFSHRNYGSTFVVLGYNSTYFSNKIQAFEETQTHMSIKINRLEEGHNSYPLVCRRPAETVSIQRRQTCYRWGTPAHWSLVPPLKIFWITWDRGLSFRCPPSGLLVFRLCVPPCRVTN